MGTLLIASGPGLGQRFSLTNPECVVGRAPDCDVVIDVGAVSRKHAKISRNGSKFFVEDLASRNGTFVNDQALAQSERRQLFHGDRVRVCDVEFSFEADTPETDPAAPFRGSDDSSSVQRAVMVDDQDSGSTIQGKFEVSSHYGGKGVSFTVTAEERLKAVLEITQSLGKALSLDAVLNQILASLFKIFLQADRGFIVLKDSAGNLIPRWTKTRHESQETIRISRTIINSVIDSKTGLLSQDASTDERFDMSQSLANFKIRSLMCAPLLDSEGNVFGALQVDTLNQRQRFDKRDLELLVSVAIQAGVAINNMQLQEGAIQQLRLQRELEVAREVQQSFLPKEPPQSSNYQFYAYYQAANNIGGDYYDYIALPDGRLAVVVADVVGHGVPAALLMAKLAAEARFCLATNRDPAAAITELNRRFNTLDLGHFATLLLAIMDPDSHEMQLVNAGHMAPIVLRRSGALEEPGEEEAGLPIGVMEGWVYESAQFSMEPGERMVLYTDGFNETMDDHDEQFGIDRIRELIRSDEGELPTLGARLISAISAFSKQPQEDDRCLVIIGRTA